MMLFRKIKIFGYFVICLFIALLAGELALRCQTKNIKTKKHIEWLRSMMTYDELLGWRHVPNAQAWSESKEYKVLYKINSKGLRDTEDSYNNVKGEFRIVCLGDSITFGWGVNAEERFTDILEGYFTNVSVINMGVQGYGIDQELLFLIQEGVKYKPDLILIYVIPADFVRACYSKMWDRPKPQFSLTDKNELVLSNIPVPKVDVFSFRNPTLDQVRYLLAKKSYLFWFIQDKIYLWEEAHIKPINYEHIKIKLAKAILKGIERTANVCGAKVVIVGNIVEDKEIPLEENSIYFCSDPLSFYNGSQVDIRYIEWGHPNVLGHKLIAEAIYNFLIENELVPKERRIEK